MLKIDIPAYEGWDEQKEEFVSYKGATLTLEHSLVSISKWESKWCKPFLEKTKVSQKTKEEMIDYIRCMTLTQNVNPEIYGRLTSKNMKEIADYIEAPMTALRVNGKRKASNAVTTSETIYAQMFALNIPIECQKWHLNKLLAVITACADLQTPKKKMSQKSVLRQNSALNAQRRAATHSKG